MPSFNQVILLGNVTRDPQLRQLPSQTVVAEFGLACNRRYRTADGEEREEATFVDCTAFGRQAEVISQYCQKGKPVFIQGRLKYDTWDDKQTGARRSKHSVIVENFQFVGSRDGQGSYPGAAAENDKRNQSGDKSQWRDGKPAARKGRSFQQSDIPF